MDNIVLTCVLTVCLYLCLPAITAQIMPETAYDNSKPHDIVNIVQLLNATSNGTDRNSFLEWLAQITGIGTTMKPIILEPPTGCGTCACGLTNKKNRIVGGQETEVNEYPWMALLMYGGRFYCAGTLINDRYALTAAHCVNGFNKDKIKVRFLEHDRDSPDESEAFDKRVIRIVIHSGYSANNYNSDMALLRLDSPIKLVGKIRPVCLPTPGKSFTGLEAIVTGWGATEEHGEIATNLQEVTVLILSNQECRKTPYGKRITDNMLCAGYKDGKKDSCQGDSGGPLHVVNGTAHHIVGVVSWGEGCAQPKYPGVYARVNRYSAWLRSNTKDACYC